jgi:hypothetical protein
MPLKDLLEEQVGKGKNLYFDFFSLDIEGAEYEALASLDFSNVAFGIIFIEADSHNERKNLAVRNLLQSNGYIFCESMHRSDWFVNSAFASIYKDFVH